MSKKVVSKVCRLGFSALLAASMCIPTAAAFADDTTTTKESDITLQYIKTATGDEGFPLDDAIAVDVPSTIPMAYRTDGSVVGPTADAWKITNTSFCAINLDANAVLATSMDNRHSSAGRKVAINGAQNTGGFDTMWATLNLELNLRFNKDDSLTAITYSPSAKATLDGKTMTALDAGHGIVDGAFLPTRNISIARGGSCGVDFTGALKPYGSEEGKSEVLYSYLNANEFKSGSIELGTVTWNFNLDEE